jgi:hypothetical protein
VGAVLSCILKLSQMAQPQVRHVLVQAPTPSNKAIVSVISRLVAFCCLAYGKGCNQGAVGISAHLLRSVIMDPVSHPDQELSMLKLTSLVSSA